MSMASKPKPTIVLVAGTLLLFGVFCQTARAQTTTNAMGTAYLSDTLGSGPTSPETLTVSYLVTETANVYTYNYTINNPVGDVLLNMGLPTSTPETVAQFSVAFDTTVPNAYLSGSETGGTLAFQEAATTLAWTFIPVNPGSSTTVTFQSDWAPTLGNANASDGSAPSPWASNPFGQQVPVPVPEPPTAMTLLAGFLLLLPFRSAILKKTWRLIE
jgi:hypothetical protein